MLGLDFLRAAEASVTHDGFLVFGDGHREPLIRLTSNSKGKWWRPLTVIVCAKQTLFDPCQTSCFSKRPARACCLRATSSHLWSMFAGFLWHSSRDQTGGAAIFTTSSETLRPCAKRNHGLSCEFPHHQESETSTPPAVSVAPHSKTISASTTTTSKSWSQISMQLPSKKCEFHVSIPCRYLACDDRDTVSRNYHFHRRSDTLCFSFFL